MIHSNNILVIGDLMVDRYYIGSVKRISPEAPVPVLRKESERIVLGGAANVISNLIAAEQSVSVCSVIGTDDGGKLLVSMLKDKKVDGSFLLHDPDRKTTIKTRVVGQDNHQFIRIDDEDSHAIRSEQCEELITIIRSRISEFNAIILSDYCKGVLKTELCQGIIALANENGIPVFFDLKERNIKKYSGAFLLKPNRSELNLITGKPVDNRESIKEAALYLRHEAKCSYVLVTLGGDGMCLVGPKDDCSFISAKTQQVFDVSGAGDTVIAYLTAACASGIDVQSAAELANIAAGIKVAKVGTTPVYKHELVRVSSQKDKWRSNKIIHLEDLEQIRTRTPGQKIVFTNGCFDILHVGHLDYLREAANAGNILIIGVNSDESVRRLKGPERPVNTENDRVAVLAALEFVDYVFIFDDDWPENVVRKVQPDVLVKGADYINKEIAGADFVTSIGGQVKLIPLTEGKSTTTIIEKMKGVS